MLKREAEQRPSDDRVRASLGVALAGLGLKEEAIRECKLAVEMMPVSRNAVVGPYRVEDLAFVYATVGEPDKAIDSLEFILLHSILELDSDAQTGPQVGSPQRAPEIQSVAGRSIGLGAEDSLAACRRVATQPPTETAPC